MGFYLLLTIPPLLLGLWAQFRVKSNFNKYSKVGTRGNMSGAEIARAVLDASGCSHVRVEAVGGFLSDHYDPRSKTLRLSPDVYNGRSISAAGVAAHEAGHAIQDKVNYAMLGIRSSLVPAVNIGSMLGPILFMAGMMINLTGLAWLGVAAFGAAAVFALVTLPVEFDASSRAKQRLSEMHLLTSDEVQGVDKVLDAAALTYVAAAIQAVAQLLYYVLLLTGRRD